jgi:ubiquinone/menaquinone biosynthesis C-methylase UbiE
MESVLAGSRLQRCRVTWLESLATCDDLLIAGVGHGPFLAACGQRFPRLRITAVDASARMLEQARGRVRQVGVATEGIAFVHATLPAWAPPAGAFDGIVTHFFLDCFTAEELGAVIPALARAARPQARWLDSDFTVPARGLARPRARAVHALMYFFFRYTTRLRARAVTDPAPWLQAAGFTRTGRRHSEWGLLRADLWRRDPPG